MSARSTRRPLDGKCLCASSKKPDQASEDRKDADVALKAIAQAGCDSEKVVGGSRKRRETKTKGELRG